MKKFLLHRIKDGEFDPSPSIQESIDSLHKSYGRAKKTIQKMHSGDEITFEESMTREFQYYGRTINYLKEKQMIDEQKKIFLLRKELTDIFEVDIWDEVTMNYEFNTLEELYEIYKLYVRKNYA